MATWKKVLVSGSNISELVNDADYLLSIGDGVFSGSAQIALGGDLTGTAANAQLAAGVVTNTEVAVNAAIDYTKINFNGSTILSGSIDLGGYATTASFNAFTASVTVDSASVSTRVTSLEAASASFSTRVTNNETNISALQSWSASLDTSYVSEVEFGTFTASLADVAHLSASQTFLGMNTFIQPITPYGIELQGTLVGNMNSITGVKAPTGSFDAVNKVYVDDISGSIATNITTLTNASASFATDLNNLSNNFNTTSGSLSTRVTDLESSASAANAFSASFSTRLTADEAKYDAYTSSFTTGDITVSGFTDLQGNLGVVGSASFDSNVTIGGNLTVNGTASFTSVDNLFVKDQFITLNSGSNTALDSGFVFQRSTANGGEGTSLFLETTSTGTYGRMAMAQTVEHDATSAVAAAWINSTEVGSVAFPPAAPIFGDAASGHGNMYINQVTGDIFIYA